MTQKWYVTLHHPKLHPPTKFWIPTFNNIRQGSKIALVRSYIRVPQAAGQEKILIFLMKIKFFPIYANIFCNAGQVPIFRNFEACKRYALDMIFLKTRPEVKVTVTCKWYKTLHHPKMHSHTKFGIPISNNKRDMLLTQLLLKLGQRSRSH